jgi:hypothetical protein
MTDKRWKHSEREIAKRIGGKRVPLLGREGTDLDHPVFFIKVKSRRSIAPYLWDTFLCQILQAARLLKITDKIPAIAIHRPGMNYDDTLICFRARIIEGS